MVFMSSTALAQNWVPPPSFFLDCWSEHLSQLPSSSEGSCVHQGTAHNVAIYSEVEVTEDETAFLTTLVGNCGVWDCGETDPTVMANCGYTELNQTCWSANGSVGVEIKWNLLARLGPEFEFGGELSDCKGEQFHAGITGVVNDCMERDCVISTVTVTKTNSVIVYEEVAEWDCTMSSGAIISVGTVCGELSGDASMDSEVRKRIWFSLERVNMACIPCGEICMIQNQPDERSFLSC